MLHILAFCAGTPLIIICMALKDDLVFIYYYVKTISSESDLDMLLKKICLSTIDFYKNRSSMSQKRGEHHMEIPHHRRHINPWHPGITQVNQQYIIKDE